MIECVINNGYKKVKSLTEIFNTGGVVTAVKRVRNYAIFEPENIKTFRKGV